MTDTRVDSMSSVLILASKNWTDTTLSELKIKHYSRAILSIVTEGREALPMED